MSEGLIRGIDVHTYLVKDPARAVAFWRDTMGLKATMIFEGLGAEFELPDGTAFGLWKLGDEEGGWVKGNGVMFAVPKIDEAIEFYKARGVTIHGGEESPVCHMAFAEDSEGNSFVLHQRK
jgi:predicted enzyme related to lactoylglutathione lyase